MKEGVASTVAMARLRSLVYQRVSQWCSWPRKHLITHHGSQQERGAGTTVRGHLTPRAPSNQCTWVQVPSWGSPGVEFFFENINNPFVLCKTIVILANCIWLKHFPSGLYHSVHINCKQRIGDSQSFEAYSNAIHQISNICAGFT